MQHKCRLPAFTVSMDGCSVPVSNPYTLQPCRIPATTGLTRPGYGVCLLQGYYVCKPELVADYAVRLEKNTVKFRTEHHSLYLGGNGLKPFSDPRLTKFW